ncbi:MAG TPA: isoprenylcysteine carboxylmethyltransferase family protein [Patescibacteria group bacterium]|nr:isoprenylcysteine carboxylmethyltransferase family protein [Patescibacteria group bacterium]
MSGELIAWTAALSFVLYSAIAIRLVARVSPGRRRIRRGGTVAQLLPAFVWVPYVVIALRPGPELPVPDAARWIGLALIVGGIAFSIWAARTLGRHFDMEVEVHEGHEVVDRGPFAIVRHPVYLGLAVHFIGACLATGNWLLIAGTLLGTFPALYVRAAAEERLLRESLGPAYDAYAHRVPMLVPVPRP